MIFIDSNVPMYLVGAPHPHKIDAQHLLERAVADRQRLVTSAEVSQRIVAVEAGSSADQPSLQGSHHDRKKIAFMEGRWLRTHEALEGDNKATRGAKACYLGKSQSPIGVAPRKTTSMQNSHRVHHHHPNAGSHPPEDGRPNRPSAKIRVYHNAA